jgi:multisubunit Na+/H+ antiporter MnhC subunit
MEQYRFVQWLMQFPALTVMVFLRQDLGYRLLNPLSLIGVNGFVFFSAGMMRPYKPGARATDLMVFAIVAFVLGMVQHIRRWWQLDKHNRQHSYYIGSSLFYFRWVPEFVRENRRMERFVDPVVCALIGLALLHFSHALACWLLLSAVCLRAFEHTVHEQELNRRLDMVDGLMNSEQQASVMEQYEQGPWSRPRTDQGIPTGLDEDVRKNIKRQKNQTRNRR